MFIRVVNEDLTESAAAIALSDAAHLGTEDTETPPWLAARYAALMDGRATLDVLPHKDHHLYAGTGAHLCGYKIRGWAGTRVPMRNFWPWAAAASPSRNAISRGAGLLAYLRYFQQEGYEQLRFLRWTNVRSLTDPAFWLSLVCALLWWTAVGGLPSRVHLAGAVDARTRAARSPPLGQDPAEDHVAGVARVLAVARWCLRPRSGFC